MLTLMSVFLVPRDASCRLTGEAELGYVNYESSTDTEHVSTHSLTQRYSVLYDTSGRLVNGRLGKYDVALGYEWLAFDTGIKANAAPANNLNENKGHLIFNGDLLLDPKEIPLRLSLYSRDLSRSTFLTDSLSSDKLFDAPSINGGLSGSNTTNLSIPANTATGISGGTRIDSGATLVAGVKNGMTNGYNEILRHFPMLMLDYRDTINKDSSSTYPVDNRLTRLAFVSLNKKDNWFHYRFVTYNDYIDHLNNYNETQFQLGTVDQLLQRRWIDFTNWLRVSADGQLTRRVNERSNDNFEEFSLNLFGTARRESWELRSFNNFTRLNENDRERIVYKTSLPVYASGIITPTARWSAYSKYDDSHTNDNNTAKGEYFTTGSGGYNIDAFSKSSFTLSQGLSVEQVSASNGADSLIMTGHVGTASTPKFSRDLSLKADYDIRDYRNSSSGGSSSFIDQVIKGSASYDLAHKLRLTAEQTNRFTTGTSQTINSSDLGVTINSPQYQSPRATIGAGKSSYQTTTALKIAWNPKPRLNAGLSASEDVYVPESGVPSGITNVTATLDYAESKYKISLITSYNSDDAINSEFTNQIASSINASYIFSRSLDAKAGFSYYKAFGGSPTETINAEQSLNYNYYKVGGMANKLFEINESFTSIDEQVALIGASGTSVATKQRTNTLLLGTKYFPLRQIMIAGGARYAFVNGYAEAALSYYGSLSARYQLLEASLDYTYGKNKTDNRVEKRISANIKKRF